MSPVTSTLPTGPASRPAGAGGRTVSGLCRLTVRAPAATIELAVPTDVPIADLLPTILDLCGPGLAEQGLEHEGWVLQRLGAPPLDPDATAGRLDLLDGEVLHLRPRTEAMPTARYDDLVEGVSENLRRATPAWNSRATRAALLAAIAVALAAALLALALPGDHVTRAATAGFAGLLLLGGALSAAQAVGDRAVGTLLALGGVAQLAGAGAIVITGTDTGGARLLAGGFAGLAASALATAVVAWLPPFAATALVSLAAVVAGATTTLGAEPAGAAAAAVLLALVVGHLAPSLAFRAAGLRLPALPTTAAQLQDDIEPHPAAIVEARSRTAAVVLDATAVGAGLILAVALVGLAAVDDWPARATAAVVSVLLLVHQRGLDALVVRTAALVPGVAGLAGLAVDVTLGLTGPSRVAAGVGGVLVAFAAAVAAASVPGRRVLPYWGRIADLVQTLCAAAVLPLVALTLGAYSALRGIGG